MADEVEATALTGADNTASSEQSKTFTQDELNAIVEQRLKREHAKYADYDDLKTKASKFDEAQEAQKSELEKLSEKYAKSENRMRQLEHQNLVYDVASRNGIPSDYRDFLTGDSEEDLEAQAKRLSGLIKGSASQDESAAGKTATVPSIGVTPGRRGDAPLNERIAAAEKKGDLQEAMRLKAFMLQSPKQ